MSAHLIRFLMTFLGALSLRSRTAYSLVEPRLLTDAMLACQRHQRVDDDELGALDPRERAQVLVAAYREVLSGFAQSVVAYGDPSTEVGASVLDQTFQDVLERLPLAGNGDLSIDAVNAAIGLQPREGARAPVFPRPLKDGPRDAHLGKRSGLSRSG